MHADIPPRVRRLSRLCKSACSLLLTLALHSQALGDDAAGVAHFSYSAPDATSVGVAGEFNSWQPAPMIKGADGKWTADIPMLPGQYGYKFMVNGTDWELDPNNPAQKVVGGITDSAITVTSPGAPAGSPAMSAAPAASGSPAPAASASPAPAASASPAPSASAASGSASAAAGTVFTYSNPGANAVFIAGQFNNWDTTATPMQKDGAGVWTARVPLTSGSYQYKLLVDGAWMLDPGNPQQADDGSGNMNSVKVVGGGGAGH